MSEEELRQAWKSGKLKELIQFRGSQVPCARIRNEVRWLVQHNRFGSGVVTSWDIVIEIQRHVLDPLDRTGPWQALKPREKLEAYVFWCQITNGIIPDVDEDNWIFFWLLYSFQCVLDSEARTALRAARSEGEFCKFLAGEDEL